MTWAALFAVPGVAFYVGARALERFATSHRRGRDATQPDPPLERLVHDLRRLDRSYRAIQSSDLPARAARLRAVGLAYDDTLRRCCLALDLPEPGSPPLTATTRLSTEAALAQRGLEW